VRTMTTSEAIRDRAWQWLDAYVGDHTAARIEVTPEDYVREYLNAFAIARRECSIEGFTL
jgi:hypothetical protein